MKATGKICLSIAMAALVSVCTANATPQGGEVAVAVSIPVVVTPTSYVWDGVEFVGEYNGTYMYLNTAGVWVATDPVRLERFQAWGRIHPDWRKTAIRYDRAHRPDPRNLKAAPAKPVERKNEVEKK